MQYAAYFAFFLLGGVFGTVFSILMIYRKDKQHESTTPD